MFRIAGYAQRSKEIRDRADRALLSAGFDLKIRHSDSEGIRLVFAGQFNAGKSSILKMLTGREDIEIGDGITTQEVNTYEWNGLEVVDTPGVHTTLRPDHDELSYDAIATADMLVFVVTNELFDSHIASHFRKLAIDNDKAAEMILVVNKMSRTSEGNTEEQREIIREDLKKVLVPYTPEQLNLSFLDAQSYLESINESDAEYAEELVKRSGYAEFVDILNAFVDKKSIPSKLTTELYEIDNQLEKAIDELQPNSSDTDIDALEESLLQHRHLIIETRGRTQQEVRDIFTTAASQIRDLGLNAADLLVEGCNKEDVELELAKSITAAQNIIDKSQAEALEVIDARLNEMGEQLDEIENTEFSKELKHRLSGKFEGLPEGIQRIIANASPGFQKAGQAVLNNAYKAGTQGGLKLTNFSGSTIHQMVLKAGHGLNFKFKPWQAIKITRGIAIGGQVLSVLGVGLSIFAQLKADHDEDRIRNSLKVNRQNVRSQFNAAANELEEFARQYIRENVNYPLGQSIAAIDDDIQEVRDTRSNRSASCRELESIQKDCRLLIQDIHENSDHEVA